MRIFDDSESSKVVPMLLDKYEIKLTLLRDMLATNPSDPNILDTHIINKQREMIAEKNKINKDVNKYLDQLPIAAEKGEEEVNRLLDSLEKLIGVEFTPEERIAAIAGELDSLKQTFQELDLRGTTVFFWDKKTNLPCIGDHMIYGFLKAASEAIGRTLPQKKGKVLHSISYTQSLINQHVRCEQEFIPFSQDVKRDSKGFPIYLQRSLRAKTAQGERISLAKSEVIEAGASLKFTLKIMNGSQLNEDVLKTLFSYGEMTGLGQWRNSGKGMFKVEIEKLK